MSIKRRTGLIVNILVLLGAITFSFPGVIGKINQAAMKNKVVLTYSYSSPYYKVDVKDIRNEKEIRFILEELDKSRVLGADYPESEGSVIHEGSFFIVKRLNNTYQILTSICWYGEKSNICLVQRDLEDSNYVEMTPGLKEFFKGKFLNGKG